MTPASTTNDDDQQPLPRRPERTSVTTPLVSPPDPPSKIDNPGRKIIKTVAVSACGPDVPPETNVSQKTQQFNELMQRPDLDQARYEEMYQKVRAQITAIVPTLKWHLAIPATGASCGNDFAAVNADLRKDDAEVKGLANWWPKATCRILSGNKPRRRSCALPRAMDSTTGRSL
jgi:hypothetical protein